MQTLIRMIVSLQILHFKYLKYVRDLIYELIMPNIKMHSIKMTFYNDKYLIKNTGTQENYQQ